MGGGSGRGDRRASVCSTSVPRPAERRPRSPPPGRWWSPPICNRIGRASSPPTAPASGRAVAAVVADAARPPFPPRSFDAVLIDAPCSGLGALRRRADARWRIDARRHRATRGTAASMLGRRRRAGAAGRAADLQRLHAHRRRVGRPPVPAGFDVDGGRPRMAAGDRTGMAGGCCPTMPTPTGWC